MVVEGKGRIYKRTDGKYFLYLSKSVAEDSGFPFKTKHSLPVKVVIDLQGKKLLIKSITQRREAKRRNR